MNQTSNSALLPALVFNRKLNASLERVFAAWTEPDQLKRWFGPPEYQVLEAETDVRVGGGWRLRMQRPDGGEAVLSGEYLEIQPPTRLSFTWNSRWDDNVLEGTTVTLTLKAAGDGTELTLTHDGFKSDEMRDGHKEGWTGCLDGLAQMFV